MTNQYLDLNPYRLYFDGTVEAHNPENTCDLLLLGVHPSNISAKELTEDIKIHNSFVDAETDKINENHLVSKISINDFQIPAEYLDIDLRSFIFQKLELQKLSISDFEIAKKRVESELAEIDKRNISVLFKTIIFVVDEFNRTNTVFGVGRGSSCACYILFLIGLNLVNPLKFGIPIDEFFH